MEIEKLTEGEFKKHLFEFTDKELVERLKFIRSISETESIQAEMTRRLIISIEKFNDNSSIQTNKMIKLTKWIMWLTVVLGVLASIQIIAILK